MNHRQRQNRVVISLGGSLVVPDDIDTHFLKGFDTYIRGKIAEDSTRQFFIIVGGGATARRYRDAGQAVVGHALPLDDMDWLGIHSSRLNGHLVRTIFKDLAHPVMIDKYDIIHKATEPVVVGAAWKPGWSTDYDAVLTCENYHVESMINLSNVTQVYSADPKIDPEAVPIAQMSWVQMRKLVGDEWSPGMHAPFDPVAAKLAEELGVTVKIVKGGDFENLDKAVMGEEFFGTVIGG